MSIFFLSLHVLSVFISLLCGLLAAISDLRGMRIANHLSLIVVLSFCPVAVLAWSGALPDMAVPGEPAMHALSFLGVFVLTLALFVFGVLGAGDAKLMSAYSLWLGPGGLVPFVFATALTGFVLALLALVIRRFHVFGRAPAASWPGRLHAGDSAVPYGVAICAGAMAGYAATGYFNNLGGF